jgi:mono/diheme cytochrome c family protein
MAFCSAILEGHCRRAASGRVTGVGGISNASTKQKSGQGPACVSAMIALGFALSPVITAAAQDRAQVDAGESVYNDNCQICHGERLVSTGQTFDLRRLTENDRARFDSSVRNGKNQMPPWKGVLTDEEIDQAWHYIRSNAYQK